MLIKKSPYPFFGALLLTGFLYLPILAQDTTQALTEQELNYAQSAYIKGLEAFENEEYERALDLLTEAYIKLPDHAGVNYAMADAYLRLDDLANAAFYGKKAVELDPRNKWYHLKLIEIYRRAGRNQATVDQLQEALTWHPKATDILYQLAEVYAGHGEPAKSNEIYNRILQITGPDITVHLQKVHNFNEMGSRDSSIAELKRMQELDPDNLNTLKMLSSFYLETENRKEAKKTLKKALDKNPRDPQTLVLLSDIYVNEQQWDSVGTFLGNVMEDPIIDNEDKLDIASYLFSRYQRSPDNNRLRNATQNVLDLWVKTDPEYGPAHSLSADFYLSTGRQEQALEALEKTNELLPDNEMAWRQRMQILLSTGDYEKVIEIGKIADRHVPQDPFIQFFLGNALFARQEYQQAIHWLKQATGAPARRPFKSVIFGVLADAYAAVDMWNDAAGAYDEALKLDPENDTALNNYAYYLSERDLRLDEAEKMVLKALELNPENAAYLDTAGWVYFKKEAFKKARQYIKASIDTGQASAEVYEHMGDVMQKLGKPDEARSWWKKAFEMDSSRTHLKDKISK